MIDDHIIFHIDPGAIKKGDDSEIERFVFYWTNHGFYIKNKKGSIILDCSALKNEGCIIIGTSLNHGSPRFKRVDSEGTTRSDDTTYQLIED